MNKSDPNFSAQIDMICENLIKSIEKLLIPNQEATADSHLSYKEFDVDKILKELDRNYIDIITSASESWSSKEKREILRLYELRKDSFSRHSRPHFLSLRDHAAFASQHDKISILQCFDPVDLPKGWFSRNNVFHKRSNSRQALIDNISIVAEDVRMLSKAVTDDFNEHQP